MKITHKFTLDEAKEIIRKTNNVPETEGIEIEDVKTSTITIPYYPPYPGNITHPLPPNQYTTPNSPIYPQIWC